MYHPKKKWVYYDGKYLEYDQKTVMNLGDELTIYKKNGGGVLYVTKGDRLTVPSWYKEGIM